MSLESVFLNHNFLVIIFIFPRYIPTMFKLMVMGESMTRNVPPRSDFRSLTAITSALVVAAGAASAHPTRDGNSNQTVRGQEFAQASAYDGGAPPTSLNPNGLPLTGQPLKGPSVILLPPTPMTPAVINDGASLGVIYPPGDPSAAPLSDPGATTTDIYVNNGLNQRAGRNVGDEAAATAARAACIQRSRTLVNNRCP